MYFLPVRQAVVCAVTFLGFANAAVAADLSGPQERAVYEPLTPQPATGRQFYVRGDVGIGRYGFGGFSQSDLTENGGSFISNSIGDAATIGAGFGWQINNRFRVDLTGEYRATAAVKGLDNLSGDLRDPDGATLQANTLYQGNMRAYVGLLNGYWDMTKWRGFTPYVGAGIGLAHIRMSDFTFSGTATVTDPAVADPIVHAITGTGRPHNQTNLAWALMAGTSYDLSPNAKLDLGYRYLNLGSGVAASTGLLDCVCGTVGAPLKISDVDAHEFRLGIRWLLAPELRQAEFRPSEPLK